MLDAALNVPTPVNEPVLGYGPGSPEKARLKAALERISKETVEIPCVIGGERVTTGRLEPVVMPHRHRHVLGHFHCADADVAERAVRAAADARREWATMRWEDRAAVFLRAAELLATTWRDTLNAATMAGQSKTAHQAEIDAACELIDFWRFNVHFADQLYRQQPISSPGVWNQTDLRPLEGFTLALTPFNFTAIAGNLPTASALMGNTVIWKPSESQMVAAWHTYRLLEEAGLPPGVINFVPGFGHELAPMFVDHPDFAALHFTGSTEVFRSLWKRTAANLDRYKSFPRLVGETGGKDFIVAHPSADPQAVATAIVRGAFEFQGQKCSAASRVYVARSVWAQIEDELIATIDALKVGDVADFSNFMGAVIKQAAFDRHAAAIAEARETPGMAIRAGGQTDGREGWFVRPTLITTDDPGVRLMRDELFGPIVTVHVYPDAAWSEMLRVVDATSPYALTGAVFARDRGAIVEASGALRHAAGNFYVNDKPTGAVVGQQPFGGARASGTDDKAGSALNLLRFVAARTIKETFVPPTDWRYPFLREA
ncbi:MAG: L-glutamate gamma-semialdehyde dehydrogenase [Kofleriaceae bacterium]|nr:L-glutamate gamma-semialdehyde dehydrogenase [Myxococcales bacterium]MCB9563014.1 L-glutamate gamma-semialdehyde dehydrogenase [Kofleriaceae bacterium]